MPPGPPPGSGRKRPRPKTAPAAARPKTAPAPVSSKPQWSTDLAGLAAAKMVAQAWKEEARDLSRLKEGGFDPGEVASSLRPGASSRLPATNLPRVDFSGAHPSLQGRRAGYAASDGASSVASVGSFADENEDERRARKKRRRKKRRKERAAAAYVLPAVSGPGAGRRGRVQPKFSEYSLAGKMKRLLEKAEKMGVSIAAIFNELDEDGDGHMTRKEFRAGIKHVSFATKQGSVGGMASAPPPNLKEIDQFFDWLDTSGNGEVELDEFMYAIVGKNYKDEIGKLEEAEAEKEKAEWWAKQEPPSLRDKLEHASQTPWRMRKMAREHGILACVYQVVAKKGALVYKDWHADLVRNDGGANAYVPRPVLRMPYGTVFETHERKVHDKGALMLRMSRGWVVGLPRLECVRIDPCAPTRPGHFYAPMAAKGYVTPDAVAQLEHMQKLGHEGKELPKIGPSKIAAGKARAMRTNKSRGCCPTTEDLTGYLGLTSGCGGAGTALDFATCERRVGGTVAVGLCGGMAVLLIAASNVRQGIFGNFVGVLSQYPSGAPVLTLFISLCLASCCLGGLCGVWEFWFGISRTVAAESDFRLAAGEAAGVAAGAPDLELGSLRGEMERHAPEDRAAAEDRKKHNRVGAWREGRRSSVR